MFTVKQTIMYLIIALIILVVVFLIITPIILVKVLRNHNSAKTFSKNTKNQKHGDKTYEKFHRDQQDDDRRRGEQYRQEQRRQRDGQNSNDNFTSKQITIQDAYEILEVNEKYSMDEIKQSRNRLSLQWHPDKHRSIKRKQIAEAQMKLINEAFEILKNKLNMS